MEKGSSDHEPTIVWVRMLRRKKKAYEEDDVEMEEESEKWEMKY
jgi:hypothetical protein